VAVIFGLTDETELEVPYDKADDEFYTLRAITDDLRESWRKASFKGKHRDRTGAEIEHYDDELRERLMKDHLFANWRGAIYLNAEDFHAKRTSPCNLENKLIFTSTQQERYLWALEVAQSLGERLAQKLLQQRDNFRAADSVPSGQSEPELHGVSGAS
jgi:hypothetical protein